MDDMSFFSGMLCSLMFGVNCMASENKKIRKADVCWFG